jgi:hypothetical protein
VHSPSTPPIHAAYIAGTHRHQKPPLTTHTPLDIQKQSGEVLLNLPDLHILILLAVFLILAVVVPAASASAFRRPSFLSDASHSAAGRGFLLADGFKGGLRLRLGCGVGGVGKVEE